jgi:hypothetical protein
MRAHKTPQIFCVLTLLCASARAGVNSITDFGTTVDLDTTTDIAPTTETALVASGVATFENYAEGAHFKPSFTDPVSGIAFSNSTAANGNFVIEYANSSSWTAPMFQDNHYLAANGYAPGIGASLPARFGFTATLARLSLFVELDLVGLNSGSSHYDVSFLIQNTGGATLASQTVSFTSGLPKQYHLRLDSSSYDIASFRITTLDVGCNAIDNINAFAPEPSVAAAAGALMLMPALRRRKSIRITPRV